MSEYSASNPSPRFKLLGELYRQVHEQGIQGGAEGPKVFGGGSLLSHIDIVAKLAKETGARTVLDYGSGKGLLYSQKKISLPNGPTIPSVREYWGVDHIQLYDPGVEEFSTRPETTFDGVVSTDVLEHIPEEDIDWVLEECFHYARSFLYMNIASYPAKKILPNGWNAHITVQSPAWWRERFQKAARNWAGKAYVFDVTEKRKGLLGSLVNKITGTKLKLTRITSSS
jgi:hypothetical protein